MRVVHSVFVFLAASLTLAQGCVTEPYTGTVYASGGVDREIRFSGYTDQPNQTVSLQVDTDAGFVEFATTVSGGSPAASVGALPWSDAVEPYRWSLTTQIGEDGQYWPRDEAIRVRAVTPSRTLVGFESYDQLRCMLTTGGTVNQAYVSCVGSVIADIELIDVD